MPIKLTDDKKKCRRYGFRLISEKREREREIERREREREREREKEREREREINDVTTPSHSSIFLTTKTIRPIRIKDKSL